ncbi:hypothetical protein ACI78V_08340 [Geodermatophilus sp. SYSU D00742]
MLEAIPDGSLPRTAPVDAPPVHPIVAAAFRGLTEAAVPWVLLRGADDLAAPSGDVDLLVDRDALPRVDVALAAAGLHRLGSRGHGSHRFYFAYDADDDLWVTLDVVSEIEFGRHQSLRSPLAAACLGRRRQDGALSRPAPEDEAWLLLLHLLLDKGTVPAGRRQAARAAAQVAGSSPVADFLDREIAAGSARRVRDAVLDEHPGRAEELARELTRRWVGRRKVGARLVGGRNRLLRRLEVPFGRPTGGLVAALVGPDGAGKTTVAEALRARYPLPSRAVHMGIWREGPWDHRLSRLPGGRVLQRTGRIVRSSLAARYHRARGRLVLLDRFAQDVLLPGVVDTSRGGRLNRLLSLHLAPEPQLVMLLDAPGELMFARKREHSPGVLEERRQGYLALVSDVPNGVVLDATEPVDRVTRAALAAVWRTIVAGRPRPVPAGRNSRWSLPRVGR